MSEELWVTQQRLAFIGWCNASLATRNLKVKKLEEDFIDGILLWNLLEIISQKKLPKIESGKLNKFQQMANLDKCFKFMTQEKIVLVNIGANDLQTGNLKLILGLIWTLILKYQIASSSSSNDSSVKSELLQWVNEHIPQKISDFKSSFSDGYVFCHLVNTIKPGTIDIKSLSKLNAISNLNKAFDCAESFGIPKLLDANFVSINPDELSIMTYVSFFRQKIGTTPPISAPVINQSEQEINSLKSQIQELEKQLKEEKTACSNCEEKNLLLQKQIEEEKQSNQILLASKIEFEKQLAEITQQTGQISKQMEELNQTKDKLEKSHFNDLENFNFFSEQIKKLRKQCVRLTETYGTEKLPESSSNEKSEDMWKEVRHNFSYCEKFLITVDGYFKDIEVHNNQLKETYQILEKKTKELTNSLVESERIKGIQVQEIESLKHQLKDMIEESSKLRLKYENLEKEMESNKRNSLSLTQSSSLQISELERIIKEKEITEKSQYEQISQLQKELNASNSQIDQSKLEVERLQKVNVEQQTELEKLQTQLQNSLKNQSESNSALQNRIIALEKKNTSFQNEIDSLQESLVESQNQTKQAQEETQKQLETLKELQNLMVQLMKNQQEFEAKIKILKKNNAAMNKQLTILSNKVPLYLQPGNKSVPPPKGTVSLVFTDVQGSTTQWEADAAAMAEALKLHNELMRKHMEQYQGYEVKTEGDAFMIAFSDVHNAIKYCLLIQDELLKLPWSNNILKHPDSAPMKNSKGEFIFNGFRVRMGVHVGNPSAEEDPVTKRMDYFGPMVNRSARVESVAHGGQIVISQDVLKAIEKDLSALNDPAISPLGRFKLKGIDDEMELFQILPFHLTDREFPKASPPSIEEKKTLQDQIKVLQEENMKLTSQFEEIDKLFAAANEKLAKLKEFMEKENLINPAILSVLQDIEKTKDQEQKNTTPEIDLNPMNSLLDGLKSENSFLKEQLEKLQNELHQKKQPYVPEIEIGEDSLDETIQKWNHFKEESTETLNLEQIPENLDHLEIAYHEMANQLDAFHHLFDNEHKKGPRSERKKKIETILSEIENLSNQLSQQQTNLQSKRPTKQSLLSPTKPVYHPVKGDKVDELFYEMMKELGITTTVKRLGEGIYLLGNKKLNLKILSGHLVVRVGGGFMKFSEWIEKYGKKEGILVSSIVKSGVGTAVLSGGSIKIKSGVSSPQHSSSQTEEVSTSWKQPPSRNHSSSPQHPSSQPENKKH